MSGPREGGGGGGLGGLTLELLGSLQRRPIKLKLIKILNINVQDNQPGAVLVSTIPSYKCKQYASAGVRILLQRFGLLWFKLYCRKLKLMSLLLHNAMLLN